MARLTSLFRTGRTSAPLRILVHVSLITMLRHFEGVILELARRGHTVRIASPEGRSKVPPGALLRDRERISFVDAPPRRSDAWAERVYQFRCVRDYLRYLEPRFAHATKLRGRAMRKMVSAMTDDTATHLKARCPHCDRTIVDEHFARSILRPKDSARANVAALFALMEQTIPSDARIEAFLRAERPDLLLVTPLVKLGSYQADYVKSAKALGIPVVFPVFSWDNLSTKGLIHVLPDLVLVWNERQRTEAIEMHGVAAEDVLAIGAPRFDAFFALQPQTTRQQFCESHGFDAAQPIISYLCSSEFVAGHEIDFVMRWIDEIRQAPALRSCNVLIRPHPREKAQWKQFATDKPHVTVSFPSSIKFDDTLYDTVHHSAAVVGLNTSAQLEAGIVGKPVLTLRVPEFAAGQEGTVHFHYLLKEHGGFVDDAPDFDVHRRQLTAAVAGEYDADAIRAFITEFLRPLGADRPATPIMADTLEAFARNRHQRGSELLASSGAVSP